MDIETAIYRLFDVTGRLLYVGVGEHPPTRWADHRRTKEWWGDVDETRTTVTWFASRDLALAEEDRAIANENPVHNQVGTLKLRKVLTGAALPDLFTGAAEIQAVLGVSRQRVQQIVNAGDFPAPHQVLVMGKIWRTPVVEEWIAENRLSAA